MFLKTKKKDSKQAVGGEIAYYNLEDWWLNILTEEERKTIKKTYVPIEGSERAQGIDEGKISLSSSSKISFFMTLSSWFIKPEYYTIAKKILSEAEKYVHETDDSIGLHFHYLSCIEIHYRNRNEDEEALNLAIEYCKKQISNSSKAKKAFKKLYPNADLPTHTGYRQLAIIYEKQGDIQEAIRITEAAIKEGWNKDDGIKRITRLKKKLTKIKG